MDENFVAARYRDVIQAESSRRGFVFAVDGQEIGYSETYLGADHPVFFENLQVDPTGTAGCDLLIGDASRVGNGLGALIIAAFTDFIYATTEAGRVVAAPDVRNARSRRAFERAGYRGLFEVQVVGDTAPACVLQHDRANSAVQRALADTRP